MPASGVTFKITDKAIDLLKIDARMTTRQVARCLCISTGSTYKISKKINELAVLLLGGFPIHCWMAKKRGRVLIARKIFKKYPLFNQRTFSNIWTVDEA